MKEERHRVEFISDVRFRWNGDILLEWEEYLKDIRDIEFGKAIESIDKRLYRKWIDGDTIFYLTNKQIQKLHTILADKP